MHQRNPYRNGIDFEALAQSYDALKPHLISESNCTRKTIDFRDLNAQRRLTEAIMLRDFGVKLHIPLNRLCPPVPNRVNYILWIQDIMRAHDDVIGAYIATIRGIDIGTGATAIYAFLACKMDDAWSMVATELDDFSYQIAQCNVQDNNMQARIDLRKASLDGRILFPFDTKGDTYHFTMCNPPFYSSSTEVASLAQEKSLPPNAVCTGAPVEMIYEPKASGKNGGAVEEGGEAGFVARMVEESVLFGTRCRWYTSMLGKLSSVLSVVGVLRKHNITNYGVTEFVQGQTRRWAVGWSLTDSRLPDSVARISPFIGPSHALFAVLPPRNTLSVPLSSHSLNMLGDPQSQRDKFEARVAKVLQEVLDGIDDARVTRKPLSTTLGSVSSSLRPSVHTVDSLSSSNPLSSSPSSSLDQEPTHAVVSPPPPIPNTVALFFVEAMRNTWSRAARRKAKGKAPAHTQSGQGPTVENKAPFTKSFHQPSTSGTKEYPEIGLNGPVLTCSVRVVRVSRVQQRDPVPEAVPAASTQNPYELEFQWIFGKDRAVFEGFTSHVGRKVTAALTTPSHTT